MAFGEVIGEYLAGIFVQVVYEGIFKCMIAPALRFPGAVIGWLIWCGRPFALVWEKGDGFQQGMVGVAFYFLVVVSWIFIFQG